MWDVGDSSLSWKPIFWLWGIGRHRVNWLCVTQTRKSVSMWSADPQQTITSNNAKVPLLVTLQHSNQNKIWTGLMRQPQIKSSLSSWEENTNHSLFLFCCKSAEYPLHCRNRRSGITPTIWLTISIFTRYFEDPVWYYANKLVEYRYSLVISF